MVTEAIALLATSSFRLSGATRMMIASSLMERIMPRMPPAVVTRSPALMLAQHLLPLLLPLLLRADHHQVKHRNQQQGQKHRNACRLLLRVPANNNAKLVATLILCSPSPQLLLSLRAQAHPALSRSPDENLSPGTFLALSSVQLRIWKEG